MFSARSGTVKTARSTSGQCSQTLHAPLPCVHGAFGSAHPWQRHNRRDRLVARITNEQIELKDMGLTTEEQDEYMELSQLQIPNPELGPLEKRVSAQFEEAIFTEEISQDDAEYWFNEPEGGWNMEPERVKKALEVETTFVSAENFGDGRTKLADLKEGTVLTGTVTSLMLYHGIQLDLGAEYDGLVPVPTPDPADSDTIWHRGLREEADIDTQLEVRIFKVRDPQYFRWPIQLELISLPSLAEELPPPESHRPAMDLRGKGDLNDLIRASGRKYRRRRYWTDSKELNEFDSAGIEDNEITERMNEYDAHDLATQTPEPMPEFQFEISDEVEDRIADIVIRF